MASRAPRGRVSAARAGVLEVTIIHLTSTGLDRSQIAVVAIVLPAEALDIDSGWGCGPLHLHVAPRATAGRRVPHRAPCQPPDDASPPPSSVGARGEAALVQRRTRARAR